MNDAKKPSDKNVNLHYVEPYKSDKFPNIHIGTAYFVKYIRERVLKLNKNFLCAIIGPTGSGKSWAAISLANMIADGEIDRRNICFRALDFMERLNSGDLKMGDVLIWDESGIDLNSKSFMSLMNRIANYILQTFRHKNLVVIFTVPIFSFLDSDTRKLIHATIRMKKIDRKKKISLAQPLLMQTNDLSGKVYAKHLRVLPQIGGQLVPVKRIQLPMPKKEIIDDYEKRKSDFTANLNKQIETRLRMEAERRVGSRSSKMELTTKQTQLYELYQKYGSLSKVSRIVNVNISCIAEQLRRVKYKLGLEKLTTLPRKNSYSPVEPDGGEKAT